jgi:hypothetical protein
MVGDAFARVFGGSVVPQEVAQALQREAEDSARPLAGGRVLAPNRYTVTLGAADHDRLAGDEQRVIGSLQDCIREHIDEQAWDTYGDVVVNLERSETLHTGQFRTSSSVDPDASRQVVAQPRTAGDGAMSQQPGQYPPEDDRRGKYGQQGGYGYDQGQGSYSADQGYSQQYGYDSNHAQGHQGPGQGYNQNYADPHYAAPQEGYDQGYGYNPNYGDSNYGQGQRPPEQNYGQQYSYEQSQDYDRGYGQGGYGYDSSYGQGGQQAPGQGYDQNYGQYGGSHPGYGYDQGSGDQHYGIPQPGYPADPGAQGYAPPAVQTGPRQLAASLTLDDGSNRGYQLTEGSNVVGRGQDAQFRLPDTGVSRRHLEITWDGQVAMLSDLGSTNGTTVNGTPVQTWQLADGDVVRVGHSSLVFRAQG